MPTNPIITQGLIYVNRAKKNERNLISAYFRIGEWLRDDFPKAGVTLGEFSEAAGISRWMLTQYRQLAETYRTIENIPAGYTMNTALKMRTAYATGGEMLPARKPGVRPRGVEAMIERTGHSQRVMHSALKAVDETEVVNDIQLAIIEENINFLRSDANELLREARKRNRRPNIDKAA